MRRFFAKLVLPVVLKPRSTVTTASELAGFGLVVYGIWRVSATAGFISAGIALFLVGILAA